MSDRPVAAPRGKGFLWAAVVVLLIVIGICVYTTMNADARPAKVKLALLTWNEDVFWEPLIRGAKDAAEQENADLTVVQSKPDVDSQNAHVKELLAQGFAGIAISPNNPKQQQDVLNDAAAKVPLVTFDADAPESKRRVFVGIDNYAAGAMAAEEVRAAIPDGGAVLLSVGSIEMANGADRRQGLVDDLLDRQYKLARPVTDLDPIDAGLKGSKYSISATIVDNGDRVKAVDLIADALKAHPETKCIVGLFSYNAPAALAAIEKVGRAGQVKIVSFDDADATQAGLEAGTIHASILQDPYRVGNEAIRVLADEVRGVNQLGPSAQRTLIIPTTVVRKENLEDLRNLKQIRQPTSQPAK